MFGDPSNEIADLRPRHSRPLYDVEAYVVPSDQRKRRTSTQH